MQKLIYTFSISLLTVFFLSITVHPSANANSIFLNIVKCNKCTKHDVKNCTKKACIKEAENAKCSKKAKKDCHEAKKDCHSSQSTSKDKDSNVSNKSTETMKKQTGTAPDFPAPQNKE